jgi:hypothetical protein
MLAALDDIQWLDLHDAYGPADSVADAIRALLSDDPERRDRARWSLSSTIYHQGDLFDSTAAAIPFLVEIFVADDSPDRNELGHFIDAIAQSAEISDEQIRDHWKRQYECWAHIHTQTESEKADADIAATRAVRSALLSAEHKFLQLFQQPPTGLAEICSQIQKRFKSLHTVRSR